jgi:hypothetical protein
MKYLYTAWIRNNLLELDEQDYEWPACIIIHANTEQKAMEWGDHLACKHCLDVNSDEFLHSNVELVEDESKKELKNVPKVEYGVEATDVEIGW